MTRNLKVNALYNMLYKALSVIFPLITAGYASRILLADGIGRVSYAQSIVAYFLMFACMGIPSYGVREIARSTKRSDVDKSFTEILLVNTISTIVMTIIYYSLIFYTNLFSNDTKLYIIVGIMLLLNLFNVDWFYQGKEDYKYIAIRSLIVKVLFTIILFLFVKHKEDYRIYALLYCLATAGNYLFNIYHLRGNVKLDFSCCNIKRHIQPILFFFMASISVEIYIHLDTIMLGLISDESSVGYYTNTSKLIRVISNSLIALGAVIFPRVSLYYDKGDIESIQKLCRKLIPLLLLLSMSIMVISLSASSEIIYILFGRLFFPATETLKIQSFLIPIFTLAGGFATPIVMATKQEKKYTFSTVICLFLHFILNILLIPHFAHNGASVASVISELVLTVLQFFYIRSLLIGSDFSIDIRNIFTSSIVAIAACYIFDYYFTLNIWFSLIIKVSIISIIMCSILTINNDKTLKYLYGLIKHRRNER